MNKIKSFLLIVSPLFVATFSVSCINSGKNPATDSSWSLISNKPGVDAIELSTAEKTLNNTANIGNVLDVNNYFKNLKLLNDTDKPKTVIELQKELNNRNIEPFDGDVNPKPDNNSFLKAHTLKKYFSNENTVFPHWLLYDIRANMEDQNLVLIITLIDFSKVPIYSDFSLETATIAEKTKFESKIILRF